MKIVLDASAGLAAVLGRAPATLLDALADASIVIAPDIYAAEVANGLWKYVSVGELSAVDAAEDLDACLGLVERFVPVATLAQEALREATVYRHPVYDLCYAVAARREGCSVLTLDARLQKLLTKLKVPTVQLRASRGAGGSAALIKNELPLRFLR